MQTYNRYIQYRIKMNNAYSAISEPVQFQGCNSPKKTVSEVNTHTLNNIPSALFRKKTGFQVKGFLQQELWCWPSHRWCLLERFQFLTNNSQQKPPDLQFQLLSQINSNNSHCGTGALLPPFILTDGFQAGHFMMWGPTSAIPLSTLSRTRPFVPAMSVAPLLGVCHVSDADGYWLKNSVPLGQQA